MKKMIASAAALLLLTATGALAQAAMTQAPGGSAMKSGAPKADASNMKSDTSAKADASGDATAKPKARHHRMAKNEAAMNASEAETTKQLNQEQASNSGSGMSSRSQGMGSSAGSGNMSDPNQPNSGMGRVQGANSGVEGRVGGTNSGNPAP